MSSETSAALRPSPLDAVIEDLLDGAAVSGAQGEEIGRSRGGLPVRAFRCGRGPIAVSLLGGIQRIAQIRFTSADVVRHPLVGQIVDAYDRSEGTSS